MSGKPIWTGSGGPPRLNPEPVLCRGRRPGFSLKVVENAESFFRAVPPEKIVYLGAAWGGRLGAYFTDR